MRQLTPVGGGFQLLPPASHLCQECAVEHAPESPHNAQSLYYQMRFKALNGRSPTWADALAHVDPGLAEFWRSELRTVGVPESQLTAPVAIAIETGGRS